MKKCVIELLEGGSWRLLLTFSSLLRTKQFARDELNGSYRILDHRNDETFYYSDGETVTPELPSEIVADLQQELERFDNTDKWRRHFQQQRQQEARRQQEVRRQQEIMREQSRLRAEESRRRRFETAAEIFNYFGMPFVKVRIDWVKEGF